MPADHQDRLLGAMLQYEMQGKSTVSFKQLSKDLGFMERTKTWRSAWRDLIETKYFIEPEDEGAAVFSGEYRMTQAGKDHASTPEYVEFMKEQNFVPQTNDAHQEKIKKRLLNEKAVQIFEKLLAHGSLTRKELATLLGCNDRSHKFNYGFKDLKTKELIEDHPSSGKGKQRLSDKAFLNPEDRPETVEVDATEFLKGKMAIEGRKKGNTSKKAGKKKSKGDKKDTEDADDDGSDKSEIKAENTNKKVKEEEEGAEEKNDDGVDVPDAVKSVSNAAETHKKVEKDMTATEDDDDDDDVETPDTVKSESKEEKNVNEEMNDAEAKDEDEVEDDKVPDTVKTGGSTGKKPPKRKARGEFVWVMDGKTLWQAQLAEPKEKKRSHSEADNKEEKVEIQWCGNGKFQMILWSKVQLEEDADADKDSDKDDSDKIDSKPKKETRKSKRSRGAKNYCEDAADEEADDYDGPKEDEDGDSHNSKSKAKRRARKRIKL